MALESKTGVIPSIGDELEVSDMDNVWSKGTVIAVHGSDAEFVVNIPGKGRHYYYFGHEGDTWRWVKQ